MNDCDCGRGYRCDAYDLPSGDRCTEMAVRGFTVELPSFPHPVGVQFCGKHNVSYLSAGQPGKFDAQAYAERTRI